jgi:predicted nuclease of predicted toxin-antitoxin system
MRVLLDECLPAGLRRDLPGHDVTTVQRMGWSGTKNGALLPLIAQAGFAVLVTVDKGVEFQQRIEGRSFGVIALRALSNDIDDLRPLMAAVLAALPTLQPGQLIRIP